MLLTVSIWMRDLVEVVASVSKKNESQIMLDYFSRFLQTLTIKIYSALVDERAGLQVTWFNSPLRGNQTVGTLVNMIQVGQWYGTHEVSLMQ